MQSILVQVGATLVVGVILIQLAHSDDVKMTRTTKTNPLKRLAGDQTKEARSQQAKSASARLAEQRTPATKSGSHPRKSPAHNKTKTKLQSRVMRSANPIEPLGDSALGSDAWSQHSLLPTFVDQEQGDEMVALASDETSQQVKVAARLSGPLANMSDSSYMKRYQADRLQREQIEDERFLAAREHQQEQNKPRSSSLVADDYYADDDDDGDSEQEHGAQLVKMDQKPSRQASNESGGGVNEQRIADFRPIEQSPSVKQAEIKNATASEQVVNVQRSANGWLPTGATQIKHQTQLDQSRPLANPVGRGEKAAGLFGGRGEAPTFGNSLSKTDMAIEYLRSILKTKQNKLQSNQIGTNSSQQQQQQHQLSEDLARFDKGLKTYYPLPVQLRDFAQPVNRSTASDQVKLTASGVDLQEVPGRFSINDVKQQTNQGIASTAAPFVPITSISPQADSSPKQTSGAETKPTAEPKVSLPSSQPGFGPTSLAEGAPLGGDYSDHIPHGLHLVKQQVQQQAGKAADSIQQKAAESMAAFASDQLPVALASQHDDKFRLHSHQPQAFAPPPHSSIYFEMRKPSETRPTQSEFKGEEFQQQVANIAPDFTKQTIQIAAGTQRNFDFDQANLDENLFKQEQQVEQTIPLQEVRVQKPIELGQTKSSPKSLEVAPAQAPIEQVVIEPEPRIVDEVANLERGQAKVGPLKQPARHQMISSKLYRNEQPPHFYEPQHQAPNLFPVAHQHDNHNQHHHNYNHPRQAPVEYGAPQHLIQHHQPHQAAAPHHTQLQAYQQYFAQQPSRPSYQAPVYQQEHPSNEHRQAKAPRIVSYNYFDGNEHSQPTNFQLGDSLLSSTGDIEHTLSNSELDAIQHQFMTAEHPVVPIGAERHHNADGSQHQEPAHRELSRLLAGLKPSGAPYKPAEPLKEMASEEQVSVSEPKQAAEKRPDGQPEKQPGEPKRKSLVVYLNHPRGDEMSRSAAASGESLGQLISEQTSGDPFVAAREFDSHGLAKESTRLDLASLQGLGGALPKEALADKDKDGLSVVVIGDAYKYKKIVLLISAKTGGLKFVPMVKDMRRR